MADTLFFYSKGKNFVWNTPREAHSEEYKATKYRHDDGDGRGLYRLDNMTSPNPRPNMMYKWMGFPFPQMGWRYQRETMQRLHDEGRIWYPTKADGTHDTLPGFPHHISDAAERKDMTVRRADWQLREFGLGDRHHVGKSHLNVHHLCRLRQRCGD